MPKLCFYMMMRQIGAGKLTYPDYPRICYPSVPYPKNAYAWEVYEYFTFCGRKVATISELFGFFVDGIGMEPNLAFSCGVLSLRFARNCTGRDSECLLQKPDSKLPPPPLLLPPIRNYRDLSLAKNTGSRKAALSSSLFDAAGRALTHGAYVRSFLRDLEKSGFRFPQNSLVCLLDAGWCKLHLRLQGSMFLRSDIQGRSPPRRFWKETFSFGEETVYVNSSWNVANKRRFDDWATTIASQAGIPFKPYIIPDLESEYQE